MAGTEEISDPPKLRGFNELIHKVSGYLTYILDHDEQAYSDNEFFELLQLAAEDLNCPRGMLGAMERSLRARRSDRAAPARVV